MSALLKETCESWVSLHQEENNCEIKNYRGKAVLLLRDYVKVPGIMRRKPFSNAAVGEERVNNSGEILNCYGLLQIRLRK
jgi:hypothetical protein